MKTKLCGLTLALLLALGFGGNIWAEDDSEYALMPADAWVEAIKAAEDAPKAEIVPGIKFMLDQAKSLNYGTSLDLLDHIDYDPAQRSQGSCGNCWVWAGTGVMEIAHDVDDSVFDRISIQNFDSCGPGWACCGGNLGVFATWYSGQGRALPWDNTNASFADGGTNCPAGSSGVACASISTTPNYPISSISQVTIPVHGETQATAVANIKNILNQDRGVYFGFALPDSAGWDNFISFWDCDSGETEATLWEDIDSFCGDEWDGPTGGDTASAHAVIIYGYNDDDADPDNHYWLVLNSWGTAGGDRPNGLYRIPMYFNYDCIYPDDGGPGGWAFSLETLDVEFVNSLPNDECADSIILEDGQPYTGSTEGATGNDLSSCASSDTLDVWHSYTPPLSGEVTISTDGSDFDTTLAVFDACGGMELACDDDGGKGTLSQIVILMTAQTYQIRVAGYGSTTGNYVLTATGRDPYPGNDYCRDNGPCSEGLGDCDSNSECASGLICVNDVGADYGWPSVADVCQAEYPGDNYCRDNGPCAEGMGDCDGDSECAGGLICVNDVGANYGWPSNVDVCQAEYPGDNYCRDNAPCSEGMGDCDGDSECASGLKCVDNVGADYGWPSVVDVCEYIAYPGDSYCTLAAPCSEGMGDCDGDSECASGLICVNDVGANYGWPSNVDVCEKVTCGGL